MNVIKLLKINLFFNHSFFFVNKLLFLLSIYFMYYLNLYNNFLLCIFQVVLVKWNEPYQKLASCDRSGVIFVWIKYEGRWSIELINDRNIPVTHFSWSHDGRMALICYRVNFQDFFTPFLFIMSTQYNRNFVYFFKLLNDFDLTNKIKKKNNYQYYNTCVIISKFKVF